MIEEGIVKLVNADAAVAAALAGNTGGYLATLPKDAPRPSWSYTVISFVPLYSSQGRNPYTFIRLQVDVYGDKGAQCIALASAIFNVLSGYKGTLTDGDATVVQAIFASDQVDFFDDNSRTFRRMLEFEIHFNRP